MILRFFKRGFNSHSAVVQICTKTFRNRDIFHSEQDNLKSFDMNLPEVILQVSLLKNTDYCGVRYSIEIAEWELTMAKMLGN